MLETIKKFFKEIPESEVIKQVKDLVTPEIWNQIVKKTYFEEEGFESVS